MAPWFPPQNADGVGQLARVINSIVEGEVTLAAGAVVQHCHLQVSATASLHCELLPLDGVTLCHFPSSRAAAQSQRCDCLSHQGPLEVPAGCLLSGLEWTASQHLKPLTLTSDIIIQGHRIELGEMKLMVYTVMGAKDDLQVRAEDFSPFLTEDSSP